MYGVVYDHACVLSCPWSTTNTFKLWLLLFIIIGCWDNWGFIGHRVTEWQSHRVTDTQGYSVYGWVKFFCAWFQYTLQLASLAGGWFFHFFLLMHYSATFNGGRLQNYLFISWLVDSAECTSLFNNKKIWLNFDKNCSLEQQ